MRKKILIGLLLVSFSLAGCTMKQIKEKQTTAPSFAPSDWSINELPTQHETIGDADTAFNEITKELSANSEKYGIDFAEDDYFRASFFYMYEFGRDFDEQNLVLYCAISQYKCADTDETSAEFVAIARFDDRYNYNEYEISNEYLERIRNIAPNADDERNILMYEIGGNIVFEVYDSKEILPDDVMLELNEEEKEFYNESFETKYEIISSRNERFNIGIIEGGDTYQPNA